MKQPAPVKQSAPVNKPTSHQSRTTKRELPPTRQPDPQSQRQQPQPPARQPDQVRQSEPVRQPDPAPREPVQDKPIKQNAPREISPAPGINPEDFLPVSVYDMLLTMPNPLWSFIKKLLSMFKSPAQLAQ